MRLTKGLFAIAGLISITACGSGSGGDDGNGFVPGLPKPQSYRAELTRTEYGIAHISADDWGSLGFGHGYAFAQDSFCQLMEDIIRANGRSMELLPDGRGDEASDFLYTLVNDNSDDLLRTKYLSQQPQYVLNLVAGYAAGFNKYLTDTGIANLPLTDPACRGASWVRQIEDIDLWKYFRLIQLQAGMGQSIVKQALMDVSGPDLVSQGVTIDPLEITNLKQLERQLLLPNGGSNGIALGRDATQNASGMLLGNPHQPWQGAGSFYQVHLTIPGEYDAMGAALKGFPKIAIGFNKDVAWTHTVSIANRFSLFELKLKAVNPLRYLVDGVEKQIEPEIVTIQVRQPDNSLVSKQHVFYRWEHGYIVNLKTPAAAISPALGTYFGAWPTPAGTVYALRDANIDNLRGIDMWVNMGKAESVAGLADAMKVIGNPLFHTLAADRNGDAFYGEISAVPRITQGQLDNCVTGLNGLLADLTNDAIIALNGATNACQWGIDADAPSGSGLYGYNNLPKLFNTTYAANSNDSYWLSNPDTPLTGFPSVMGFLGHEDKQQNLRTQINHAMVAARLAGTDGFDASPLFTIESLQQLMYSNRVFAAELVLDNILELCVLLALDANPDQSTLQALQACPVLTAWDRRADNDSVGTAVFTEFWKQVEKDNSPFENAVSDDTLWSVDFNASAPLTTPSGFDISLAANRARLTEALSEAVLELGNAGVSLFAPWRQVQVYPRNLVDIPIHGGRGSMGVFGAISSGLVSGGYRNIGSGNSYIQTVTWDSSECPVAEAVITHSQSIDPLSPHYGDQTALYSNKEWVDMPFCSSDIEAATLSGPVVITGP